MWNIWRGIRLVALSLVLIISIGLLTVWPTSEAQAEYGDVVINNYSSEADMRPPVFPHWFHRIRFRCKVCHADLGFEFKAGGNDISMVKIFEGEYCGACHNGEIAWSVENCSLCHSGNVDAKTDVHNSTLDMLVAPPQSVKKKDAPPQPDKNKKAGKP
ncbi:MAG: hypothetical protein JKY27_03910 [Magnetovibrio sp.]|nr:hypothetical protein [Magnetovibrio sp.]